MYEHVRTDGNVLGIRASVREPKHLIALLESALALLCQLLDDAAELDAQRRRRLRGDRIHAFTLQQVHAVESESLDTNERLRGCRLRSFDGADVQVRCGAFTVFDVCRSRSAGVE